MRQYHELLERILQKGKSKSDPQGIGNYALCGHQMRFNLNDGFPLLTTKKLWFKAIVIELLWFLRGETNVNFLHKHGVTIWDEWATPEICAKMGLPKGEFGPIYGHQWRNFNGRVDQIEKLIKGLRANPENRRHKVTTWNPEDVDKVFIAPCHGDFHCVVIDGELNLHMMQRSADVFLGVPYNIASYALLTMMLAQVTGLKVGEYVHTLSDFHLYKNHVDQARLQLTRTPKPLPRLILDPNIKEIDDFRWPEHFKLEGYNADPNIPAEVGI